MRDALNQEIILGELYGYSNRANGILTITIGRPLKFNKDKVTLEILHKGMAFYENEVNKDTVRRATVSVISNTLFKLDKDYVDLLGHEGYKEKVYE